MPPSSTTTGQAPGIDNTPEKSTITSPSSTQPPAFKLRPRSNSQDAPDISGLGAGAPSISALKPRQQGIATVSPDGPVYPSSSRGDGLPPSSPSRKPPPPAFASFFAKQSAHKCASPTKKQRLDFSPDGSPSEKSEDSPQAQGQALKSPPIIPDAEASQTFPSIMEVPSTPPTKKDVLETASSCSSGKRPLSPDAEDEHRRSHSEEPTPQTSTCQDQEPSSPFTPRGKAMLQNLCISSPSHSSHSLSSMSPTPGNSSSSSRYQVINQQLPTMPTFSFSPSLNLEKDCIFPSPHKESTCSGRARLDTSESSIRETIVFSAGSTTTPLGTPKRAPRGSMATHSANSSPFHSLRGIHPGSSFKALPPRLYPNLREDSASSCASVTSMTCPSPGSSKMSTSSPRMVPLTVLSRNGSGSPAASPMKNTPSIPPFDLSQQSPLMRSLDGLAKDSTADLLSPALAQPKLEEAKTPGKGAEESPLSSDESLRLLPRIKLTPRGKRNCATSKADESPGASSDLTMPALSGMGGLGAMPSPARERGLNLTSPPRERRGLHTKPASSFLTNSPGDKEAAEMDLLSGFEHHQPGSCGEVASRGKAGTKGVPFHEAAMGDLSRIESEEAEIASLTQGPLHGPFWPHPMPPPKPEPSESRRSSLVCSDDEEGSCASYRPMPSITFDMSEQTEVPTSTGPSFLPRVPVATRKCRSLFSPVCTEEDPIESIMRADAIAEAAKSSEPLTDDDSDGEGGDFLLCLPSTSHEKEDSQGEGDEERKSPFNSIEPFGFLSESPSFSRRAESPLLTKSLSGSLTSRRRQCSNQSLRGLASPMTPTILEEGTTVPSAGESGRFGSDPFHRLGPLEGMGRRETSDATFTTFCSLSDGEASEMMSSPKFIPAKALGGRKQSTASLLSTSSLRGLDIVHEASTSSADGAVDRVPVLLPSGSSEFSVPMFKSLRSELSMNSLGLSVDSASEDTGRDLYTPIAMGPLNGRPMLSPPPLRGRVASPLPFDGNRWK